MTRAKTPKGRIVTIGTTRDGGVQSALGTGTYTETEITFGGVRVASFGYYSSQGLPAALTAADEFIDSTGLSTDASA